MRDNTFYFRRGHGPAGPDPLCLRSRWTRNSRRLTRTERKPGRRGLDRTQAGGDDLDPYIDRYIDTVLKTFEVPGLSLTVVKDGQVLAGQGLRPKKAWPPR